jgi:hypothetical protein
MCLYFSLSALRVSNSLVNHEDQRFGAVYRNWYRPVRARIFAKFLEQNYVLVYYTRKSDTR